MHNPSNIWLFLKQGFKGIFKFKVQFIIIMILSFLATFILTLSVGTEKRLREDYDQVVGTADEFSLTGSTQLYKTATTNDGAPFDDLKPISFVDFLNNGFVDALDENGGIINSEYSWIMNDKLYESQFTSDENRGQGAASSFLTRFMRDGSDTGFYKLTQKFFSDTWGDRGGSAFNKINAYDYNESKNAYLLGLRNGLANILIDDLQIARNIALNIAVTPDKATQINYLKTTAIYYDVVQNPMDYLFLDKDFDPFNRSNGDQNNVWNKLSFEKKIFANYFYNSMQQFAYWIYDQGLDPNLSPNPLAAAWTIGKTSDDQATAFYEFLMGEDPEGVKTVNQNLLPKDGQGYEISAKTGAIYSADAIADRYVANDINLNDPANGSNVIKEKLALKGYRGLTGPMFANTTLNDNNEYVLSTVTFTNLYDDLSWRDRTNYLPFTKTLSLDNNFYDINNIPGIDANLSINVDTNLRATMWQYHTTLTGHASGYDVRFRKEEILFDNISSRKFRFVVLNAEEMFNFTILQGTAPNSTNEVAISPQFAKANNILVGDYLKIGQNPTMVTGFATDTLSFFPAVDPDLPIPQIKTDAFVYGTKQTLHNIQDGFGGSASNQDLSPRYQHFLLTDTHNQAIIQSDDKADFFKNFQQDVNAGLALSYKNLLLLSKVATTPAPITKQLETISKGQNLPSVQSSLSLEAPQTYFKILNFDDSPFRLNWTLMPMVSRIFMIVTYISSAVIAIIAIIALIICIRKTIAFNAKQIGILKAMGASSWTVAISYLAFGIVIMFVVVPIAWLVGSAIQIPFVYLFAQYFGVHTNALDFDWQAFLIAFLGFGIIAMFISLFSAWLVTRKPVLHIIKISTVWSKSRFVDFLNGSVFKRSKFNVRFSLTMVSSGKKPIILLTIVVALASLLISGALAIPSIANNAVNSFYKNIKYANSYTNVAPTVNSPLSKPAVNFWQGNEKWDSNWVQADLTLDSSGEKYGYYKDPAGYMDSVSQSSPLPRYTYYKSQNSLNNYDNDNGKYDFNKLTYTFPHVVKNQGLINVLTNAFGNNFFTVLGQSFNIGTLDALVGLILNGEQPLIESLMGAGDLSYDHNLTLIENKQRLAANFLNPITNALPQIVNTVMGVIGAKPTPGEGDETWKESVINAILAQTPPFIRAYIYKSPSRLEQFGITFNGEGYIPKEETLVTSVQADTDKYSNISLTGLDRSQEAYTLNDHDKNSLYLDNETTSFVQKILKLGLRPENDKWFEDTKVWDAQSQTLTIPMISNRQAEAAYHLKDDKTITGAIAKTRQITYRSADPNDSHNPWITLPQNAWAYDDADFLNSDIYKDPGTVLGNKSVSKNDYQNARANSQNLFDEETLTNKLPDDKQNRWLDVFKMDNNKFTYQMPYDKSGNLVNEAYMFNDYALNPEDNKLASSYVRPYFEYDKIRLFVPVEKVNEQDMFHSSNNSSPLPAGPDSYYQVVSGTDVPEVSRRAWYGANWNKDVQYYQISPFSLKYKENYDKLPGGLNRLTNGRDYPYWFRYAFDADKGNGALNYQEDAQVKYPNAVNNDSQALKINFKSVGSLVSYDTRVLLIDSNIANMLLGYSSSRTYGSQISFFEGQGHNNNTEVNQEAAWNDIQTFEFRNAKNDIYVDKDDLSNITYLDNYDDANTYAPLKWHNAKLSNDPEPNGLTSSISFIVTANLGQYSLGLGYTGGQGMTSLIASQVLLSTQKALINQIYSLTISIGILLIIAILITASLLIMLVGDIYIAQYLQFMILMRALGYSNFQIQSYAFGPVAIFSLIAWLVATIVAWLIIFGLITTISNNGFAIPYGFSWWPPLLSLIVIALSFFGSLWVSSSKARTAAVSSLMNETNE